MNKKEIDSPLSKLSLATGYDCGLLTLSGGLYFNSHRQCTEIIEAENIIQDCCESIKAELQKKSWSDELIKGAVVPFEQERLLVYCPVGVQNNKPLGLVFLVISQDSAVDDVPVRRGGKENKIPR